MSLDESSGLINPNDVPAEQIIDELAVLCGLLAFQLHILRDHPNGAGIQECGGYVVELPLDTLEDFDEHFTQTIAKEKDRITLTGQLRQPEDELPEVQGNA